MTKQAKITFFTILLALSFGFSSQTSAQFMSDYEIRSNFLEGNQQIMDNLKEVDSVEEAQALVDMVEELDAEFGEHSDFLDRVLSPETYEQRLANFSEVADANLQRMERIEEKGESIEELDEEIADLTENLEESNEEIEDLQAELDAMRSDRNAFRGQAANLRAQLNERDEFILDMVDSIFVAYNDVDLETLTPDEREELGLEVDVDNVLGHIESVVDNNIDFLDTHTQLSSEDFLHLYAVQVEFERMWDNLGPKLNDIYTEEAERQEQLEEIDDKMEQWAGSVDESAWTSVSAAFDERQIDLADFDDAVSFYTSLSNYLDDAIERAQDEGGSDEELERYQQFSNVWSDDVKVRWQPHLINAGQLNYENVASIDEKLSTWKVQAQPRSYAFLMYLGLALVIIIVFAGLWLRERSKNQGGGGSAQKSSS